MIKFEFKKLFKQKIIYYLFIFSIIMSIFVLYRTDKIEIEKEFREYNTLPADYIISTAVNRQFPDNQNIADELFKIYTEKAELSNPYSSKSLDYTKIAYDKKDKLEKQQILERITKIDFEFFKDAQKFVNKYNIKFEEGERQTWEWAVYEHKYSEENGTYPKSVFHSYLSTNFARVFIYNSNIIFGYPFLFFLVLIFYNIILHEKEEGTIEFLKINAINLKKIINAKFLTMLFVILLYPIIVFSIMIIISYFIGYKIDGFNEIYRIFDPSRIRFIGAKELLAKIVFTYIVISSIFSTIIILINLKVKNKNFALLTLSSLLFIGNILTEKFSLFNNSFNIFYGMDYIRFITGRIVDKAHNNYYDVQEIYPKNIYMLPLLLGIVFIIHSILNYKDNILTKSYSDKGIKIKPKNLLTFEIKKIFMANNLVFLTLLLIILAVYNYIILNNENDSFNKFFYEKATRVTDLRNNINRIETDLERHKKETMKSFKMSEQQVENEDIAYKLKRKNLDNQIEQYNAMKNIVDAYKRGNSQAYYENMLRNSKYMFELFSGESFEYKFSTRQLSKMSRFEHEAKLKYALEHKLKPVEINSFEYSEYENFVNENIKLTSMKNESIKSNSPLLVLKILNREYRIETIIFALIILFIFNGYVNDKETNRSIDLYNLQPISKFKNHLLRIFSQMLVALILVLLFYGIIFIISYFNAGIGEINYPVVEYMKIATNKELLSSSEFAKTINLIPLWKYFIRYIFIFLLQLTFICSLITFISISSKNKKELLIKFIVVIFLGLAINVLIKSNMINLFNPITYLNTSEIANNSLMLHEKNPMINIDNSIKILSMWTIIMSLFGGIFSKIKNQ